MTPRSVVFPVLRTRFRRNQGFTLLELLVALAVMGIAVTVFMSLLVTSLDVNRTARSRLIAASLAESALNDILRNPAGFEWNLPTDGNAANFTLAPVSEVTPERLRFVAPSAMPADPKSHKRETGLYEQFRWSAFGRLPEADSGHIEVTAVVEWVQNGRRDSVALSSAIPRAQVESGT